MDWIVVLRPLVHLAPFSLLLGVLQWDWSGKATPVYTCGNAGHSTINGTMTEHCSQWAPCTPLPIVQYRINTRQYSTVEGMSLHEKGAQ